MDLKAAEMVWIERKVRVFLARADDQDSKKGVMMLAAFLRRLYPRVKHNIDQPTAQVAKLKQTDI